MYGVRGHVVEYVRGFCPTAPISIEELGPFKTAPEGNSGGDLGTSAPGVAT